MTYIDPYDLYLRFCSLVNTFQGGFFRPQTDFERAANDAYMDIWKDLTARAEKTQEITDNLVAFTKTEKIICSAKDNYYGIAKYPTDYARFSDASILVKGDVTVDPPAYDADDNDKIEAREKYLDDVKEYFVEKVDNSRWAACLQHLTKGPTLENAKMTQGDGGFKVAPRKISVIVLTYYTEPEYVKFAYTVAPGNVETGAGDLIVYNKNASGVFKFPSTMINDFLWRLGETYGIFTKDQFLTQITNKEKSD